MGHKSILPPHAVIPPTLDIGRAYSASDAAAILGITTYVLNERVREGRVKPVFETGDRRYSGYVLAQLLGWPLSEKPQDYLPGRGPVRTGPASRRRRRVRATPLKHVSTAVGRVPTAVDAGSHQSCACLVLILYEGG